MQFSASYAIPPSSFSFQNAVHLGVAYALITFESSSQCAFVIHAALFHHTAGIRITGVVNGLDTLSAYLIEEKSDNGLPNPPPRIWLPRYTGE